MAEQTMITLGGDLRVGRIGYGAMRLTGPGLWGEYPDRDGGIALLRKAVEAGVTLIDTADAYGPHSNELLIRDAFRPYPESLVIATKGGFVRGGRELSTLDAIGNRNYLRQCVYLSARRLGVDRIDLYYLHTGWAKDASFEDQVGTLAEMRKEGMIRHVGLSNVTVAQLRAAQQITRHRRRHRPFQCRGPSRSPFAGCGRRHRRRLLSLAAGLPYAAGRPYRHQRPGNAPARPCAYRRPARGNHPAGHAGLAAGPLARDHAHSCHHEH
jgi:aryl-alcohol dehydrogenase-like predicted oxidoreductase